MPNEPDPQPREEKLKARIEELEKTVKALLKAMKDIESEIGEDVMPTGTYYGVSFT